MSEKKSLLKRSIDIIKGGFNYNFDKGGTSPEFGNVLRSSKTAFDFEEMDKFFSKNYVSKEDHQKALDELVRIKNELTYMNTMLQDSGNYEELKEELKANQRLYSIEIREDIKNSNENLDTKVDFLEQRIISNGKENKKDIKDYIENELITKTTSMKNSIDSMFWIVVVNSLVLLGALYFIFTRI